ncbi:MAG TPA: restriction endonuclease [bacterium]|jgi:hypothetical protein
MPENLVIPTQIPWQNVKGKDLEELLFWLFDSMGAKDLVWRIGGEGSGAADQGRDLEFSFYTSTPDGDLAKQIWWAEAKGSSSTIQPEKVQRAVLNASGKSHVDILVIATNTVFSNPTRNWVSEWQNSHPRPIVKLWEKVDLEKLCSRHPSAVLRVCPKALSPQGQLQFVTTRYLDYAILAEAPILERLWDVREDLELSQASLLALIASETRNGDLSRRSWGAFISKPMLAEALSSALLNFVFVVTRTRAADKVETPLLKAVAYLVLLCVHRIGVHDTHKIMDNAWKRLRDADHIDLAKSVVLESVFKLLRNELLDACARDCRKVLLSNNVTLSEYEVNHYWSRLRMSDTLSEDDKGALVIQVCDLPCKIGLAVKDCPLCDQNGVKDHLESGLTIVHDLITRRSGSDKGN